MMRPMKIGGDQLMFGKGCLAHLETLTGKRASIVTSGGSMDRNGVIDKIKAHLAVAGIEADVIRGVEPDPKFSTVMRGAKQMLDFGPDIVIAVGGGSAMDAAKAMWVYYEHPELTKLEEIFPPYAFPKLRNKAILVCIPSTSGSASEVSRSIVITDDETHVKHGLGNMEMMPDIAICDPEVTASMPPKITAETGMDALTHALEALVSRRANFFSDLLTRAAAKDIVAYLPKAWENGDDLEAREKMLNASMTAGIAFTNVSLGIVHSMAHTLGSLFGVPHGLADAILLPYVMEFNCGAAYAKEIYDSLAGELGETDLVQVVKDLNARIGIPATLNSVIEDKDTYLANLQKMSEIALADGCTKTNPIIPTIDQLKALYLKAYE